MSDTNEKSSPTALGGPPAGAGLGGPPAGSGLGGPPAGAALGGASLGGPTTSAAAKKKRAKKKKAGAQPAAGSALGGPPGAALGGPPAGAALGGPATLGGPPAGAGLGGPPATLGGPPAGAGLGGPPAGAGLGGPSAGAGLGGPPATLGGPPAGAGLGGPSAGASLGGGSTGETASSNKKKKTKKKKKAAVAEPVKKVSKQSKMAALIKKQQEEAERIRLEEERLEREEEERMKKKEEERMVKKEIAIKKKKEKKIKSKENEKVKQQLATIARLKASGIKLPPGLQKLDEEAQAILAGELKPEEESNKPKHARAVESKKRVNKVEERIKEEEEEEESDDDADWDDMYDSDGEEDKTPKIKEVKVETPKEIILDENTTIREGEMRSPICCVLGHVDTGKTLLLDKIRRSNVQKGEAGGITQQIGATYFPLDEIKKQTAKLNESVKMEFNVPGLLIIDTPGHESFTNLRSRGSSLCDIAVLVVDITHGIEQQTEESIKLLKKRKTPFVVALNKIDRIFEWKPLPNAPIRDSLLSQAKHVEESYQRMVEDTKNLFAARGLNSQLYYQNKDFRNTVSIVPTSAVTGEGIPDLLMLLVQLTQKMLTDQLYLSPQLKCTILEIKVVEGLGTTADVIVSDGILREGSKIVLCGMHGPIVTTIRALLTPPPLKEIRVKSGKGNPFVNRKIIKAAIGVKVVAHNLQDAVAGSQLVVVGPDDDLDALKEEVQMDLRKLQKSVATTARGVFVQASTLGSLEALLSFLRDNKIPVSSVGIGPIHKKDITKASVMLEHDKTYAAILAFDVKIEKDAAKFAEKLGVKIFSAPIIYHLSDMFSAHLKAIDDEKRRLHAGEAVWPVVMEIMPQHIFNKKDPLVFGCTIVEGTLRLGTPISAIKDTENLYLGKVTSIEDNKVAVEEAGPGSKVAVKIHPEDYAYAYDRHFDYEHPLMSRITRHSLDRLKEFFAKQLTKKDIRLLSDMKKIFEVEDA